MVRKEGFALWFERVFYLIWLSVPCYMIYLSIHNFTPGILMFSVAAPFLIGVFLHQARFVYFGKPIFKIESGDLIVYNPLKKVIKLERICRFLIFDLVPGYSYINIFEHKQDFPTQVKVPTKTGKEIYSLLCELINTSDKATFIVERRSDE